MRWPSPVRLALDGRGRAGTGGPDVDPAVLRRRLRPKGPAAATLVLAPTPSGSRALVVLRLLA